MAILKSRIIALLLFGAYSGVAHFMPQLALFLALLVFAASPWFIARSMAFNAFNSSYRNIRFRFQAGYADVFKAIGLMGVVLAISFFVPVPDRGQDAGPPVWFFIIFGLQILAFLLIYPYVFGSMKRLQVNHSQYGSSPFSVTAAIGSFYKIFFLAIGLFIVLLCAALAIGAMAFALMPKQGGAGTIVALILGALCIYFAAFPVMIGFLQSRNANLVFNTTRLDESVSFSSTLKARKLAWLYVTNLLAIVVSFGLAIPWVVIRSVRYRLGCLALVSAVPIEQFVSGVAANVGATGEKLGEFFNIDLSL
ncbi:MAG: DUF898 family protein [Betaproteobacteria bacterium]|nr:DUF898 family protein [Betaproteobacteria bacterium]